VSRGLVELNIPKFVVIIPGSATPGSRDSTRFRVHSKGKCYLIDCPHGSRVVPCLALSLPDRADAHDHLLVPVEGMEIAIPADPPELLPLLADAGRFGLTLVGEPVPDVSLAGTVCPNCNEDDVSWLSVDDGSNIAHCDNCGCDFGPDNRR
jgi:hypothetical protein